VLLDRDLLLRVQRHRREHAGLVDRHRWIGHPPVVGARRRHHEALDVHGLLGQLQRCLDVDLVGELRVTRARGIADDRGEVDDGFGVLEGPRPGVRIADVALDEPHLGRRRLPVQEEVEHRHVAPGAQQLVHHQPADVARASRHQCPSHQRLAL
jgi:hypothetical protein